MNSKRTILAIMTLLTLTFAGFALAQTTNDPATSGTMDHSMDQGTTTGDSTDTVVGTVVSFNDNRLVVATSGGQRTFMVDAATVRPTTLSVNLPVMVAFASESGGERAVRVTENTHQSAASEAPGGSTTGGTAWPGAANKDNDVNSNTGESTNDTTGSTMGTTASGSSYGTTGSTGTTGSSMNDTATGTTGSTDTYGSTTGTQATGSTGTTGSMDTTTGSTTGSTYAADQTGTTGTTASSSDTLPATGSELPLVGLIGLLAFAAVAVLRLMR